MYLFCIPTFDQNLSVDGRPISNSDATLGQLRLYPGCVVTLQVRINNAVWIMCVCVCVYVCVCVCVCVCVYV